MQNFQQTATIFLLCIIAIILMVFLGLLANTTYVAEWKNKVAEEQLWQYQKEHAIDVDKYLDRMEKQYERNQ